MFSIILLIAEADVITNRFHELSSTIEQNSGESAREARLTQVDELRQHLVSTVAAEEAAATGMHS
jgi:hypothetical protein